jgi:hypothetical protein
VLFTLQLNIMGFTVRWPMSNEDLQIWFSRQDIPIEELVEMWLHMDQNEATRLEVVELRKANNIRELESRLQHRIQFGTAGCATLLRFLYN